jgi:hypothetical protein
MTSWPYLDKGEIESLLSRLGDHLRHRGVHAEMFVVGGRAMALAYDRERVTRDIDAVFEPKSIVYEEASRLASELGLPLDWLNDAVKGLLPDYPDPRAHTYYSSPCIDVSVASAEFLFAMKAMAARVEVDTEDLLVLARVIGLTTSEQALELVERFYDVGRLSPKSQFILEELFPAAGA